MLFVFSAPIAAPLSSIRYYDRTNTPNASRLSVLGGGGGGGGRKFASYATGIFENVKSLIPPIITAFPGRGARFNYTNRVLPFPH